MHRCLRTASSSVRLYCELVGERQWLQCPSQLHLPHLQLASKRELKLLCVPSPCLNKPICFNLFCDLRLRVLALVFQCSESGFTRNISKTIFSSSFFLFFFFFFFFFSYVISWVGSSSWRCVSTFSVRTVFRSSLPSWHLATAQSSLYPRS